MKNIVIAIGIVVLILGASLVWRFYNKESGEVMPPLPIEASTGKPNSGAPNAGAPNSGQWPEGEKPAASSQVEHQETVPPATLEDADDYLREVYEGQHPLINELLEHDHVLNKLVAAADATWRNQSPTSSLKFLNPKGKLGVTRRDEKVFLSNDNYNRYEPYLEGLDRVGDKRILDSYLLLRPLLRNAHEQLGNPHVKWDQLLGEILDKLSAMEVPTKAPELTKAGDSVFIFADPVLEKKSFAHRLLIRMGPNNSRRLQEKIRNFQAALARMEN